MRLCLTIKNNRIRSVGIKMAQSNPLNSGQQRRGRYTQRNGFASSRQIIQQLPFLLTEGHHCCQDALLAQTDFHLRFACHSCDDAKSHRGAMRVRRHYWSVQHPPYPTRRCRNSCHPTMPLPHCHYDLGRSETWSHSG